MDRLATRRLAHVISVDAAGGTALVQGCCPFTRIVETLVSRGLMPLTTPAPASRRLGGAITLTTVGASSFATGPVASQVIELQLLLPSGELVAARPEGPGEDLFSQVIGTEGPTSAFVAAARIAVVPASGFVLTRQVGAANPTELAELLDGIVRDGSWDGQTVEFVEAVSRGPARHVVSLGRQVSAAEAPCHQVTASRYDGAGLPYAATLVPGTSDLLSLTDYLRRWDPDGFWRSGHYGLGHRPLRHVWPARLRTPAVYARLDALMDRPGPAQAIDRLTRWRPGPPRVFREVAVPLPAVGDLVEALNGIVPGVPVWLVPYRVDSDDAGPHPRGHLAYCGIWGPGAHQRTGHAVGAASAIDRAVAHLGGRTVRAA
jgi:FAD/FMN-containing dehydrogenase